MTEITFTPQAWHKGGQAYIDEASALRSAVQSHLASLDVGSLGSDNGGHPVDMAISLVVPVVKDAFVEACDNLANNLEAVGGALNDTGTTYAEFERASAQHASTFIPPM